MPTRKPANRTKPNTDYLRLDLKPNGRDLREYLETKTTNITAYIQNLIIRDMETENELYKYRVYCTGKFPGVEPISAMFVRYEDAIAFYRYQLHLFAETLVDKQSYALKRDTNKDLTFRELEQLRTEAEKWARSVLKIEEIQ